MTLLFRHFIKTLIVDKSHDKVKNNINICTILYHIQFTRGSELEEISSFTFDQ